MSIFVGIKVEVSIRLHRGVLLHLSPRLALQQTILDASAAHAVHSFTGVQAQMAQKMLPALAPGSGGQRVLAWAVGQEQMMGQRTADTGVPFQEVKQPPGETEVPRFERLHGNLDVGARFLWCPWDAAAQWIQGRKGTPRRAGRR